ncbi:MAG TPA: hypothetical protein VGN64_10370, partial [Dyadobacter sp.]|nr:hypothetical protein [Dyadobacter sp.]
VVWAKEMVYVNKRRKIPENMLVTDFLTVDNGLIGVDDALVHSRHIQYICYTVAKVGYMQLCCNR